MHARIGRGHGVNVRGRLFFNTIFFMVLYLMLDIISSEIRMVVRSQLSTLGARFMKSLMGETMLAVMLVVKVARMMKIRPTKMKKGLPVVIESSTGSQMALP